MSLPPRSTIFLLLFCLLLSAGDGWAADGKITTAAELIQVRRRHDETVWKLEVEAQEHENAFVHLWDNLIHRSDKVEVLREFPISQLTIPDSLQTQQLEHGIRRIIGKSGKTLDRAEYLRRLDQLEEQGYRLLESEWHHQAYNPAAGGKPANSKVSVVLHIVHEETKTRIVVRGHVGVTWKKDAEKPTVEAIDASDLTIFSRSGVAAFTTRLVEDYQCDSIGKKAPTTIHPVIVRDLNDDGLMEVIAVGFNRVYWNQGDWKFRAAKLCDFPVRHPNAAVMADLDSDGITDMVVAGKNDYAYFFAGAPGGKFFHRGKRITSAGRMRVPVSIGAGDINHDGRPDLYIGQQKAGYQNGEIPTPYYDAADSYPAHLLLNEGKGEFRDVTEQAGLGKKRLRRNFSASFVDLDHDSDLDLLLTSDFSGTDFFLNKQRNGQFVDATDQLTPQGYAFGMSHSFGDYNLDGRIDFITIGMSSTTARRLEHMGLGREEFPDYNQARMKMGYGNRLFVGQNKGFRQAEFNANCARTGWSWGSTTLDFDRDGDQDIYVVNGQTSGKTTKDYCTRFWCHDIYYKKGERPDQAIQELFANMEPLFSGNAISWNGYEHNALLMNVDGKDFLNVGFLMNCGFEFDSRMTLSGDIDGDGRVDLLVEHTDRAKNQRHLYFVQNTWDDQNNWFGINLQPGKDAKSSPLGARVEVELSDGKRLLQHYVTGHSVWAQHANSLHFGLGKRTVKNVTVHWPGGPKTNLKGPAVNKYHAVQAP